MNSPKDESPKTSRRQFAKAAATAIVATPVLSALSSCGDKPTPPSANTPPPKSSPMAPDDPRLLVPRNPPVIIDGGSPLKMDIKDTIGADQQNNAPAMDEPTLARKRLLGGEYGKIVRVQVITEKRNFYAVEDYHKFSDPPLPENCSVQFWVRELDRDGNTVGDLTTEPQIVIGKVGNNPSAVWSDGSLAERRSHKKRHRKSRYVHPRNDTGGADNPTKKVAIGKWEIFDYNTKQAFKGAVLTDDGVGGDDFRLMISFSD